MLLFESLESQLSPSFIKSSVERFNVSRFKSEMYEFIDARLAEFGSCRATVTMMNEVAKVVQVPL